MRVFWFLSGLVVLGLGIIGVFLPLLPTVPFLLLAAFCFARCSDRWHRWLVEHPTLGPPIQDWHQRGAIRRPAKIMATASVAAAFGLSVWMDIATYALVMQALVLVGVMTFIWSRPED